MLKTYRERRDALIARLEDPKSRQTTGRLRDFFAPQNMCCLGHASDVALLDGLPGEWIRGQSDGLIAFRAPRPDWVVEDVDSDDRYRSSGMMVEAVKDYYGFRTKSGRFRVTEPLSRMTAGTRLWNSLDVGTEASLYRLNDSGWSLAEIAQVIREEPPALFVEGLAPAA